MEHMFQEMNEDAKREWKRRRKRYIAIAIVLIVVLAAIACGLILLFADDSSGAGEGSANPAVVELADQEGEYAAADSSTPKVVTEIPGLAGLLGMDADGAVAALGEGAQVQADTAVDQEESDIVTVRRVEIDTLTATSASASGSDGYAAPSVTLSLDEDSVVRAVSYRVDLSQLGIAYATFDDFTSDAGSLYSLLAEAGISVDASNLAATGEDAVQTEEVEGSDGKKTVQSESCEFEGDAQVAGTAVHWVLSIAYDYKVQLVSGNPFDITRTLTIRLAQ